MLAWIGRIVLGLIVAFALWTVVVQPGLAAIGIYVDITGPWGNGRP